MAERILHIQSTRQANGTYALEGDMTKFSLRRSSSVHLLPADIRPIVALLHDKVDRRILPRRRGRAAYGKATFVVDLEGSQVATFDKEKLLFGELLPTDAAKKMTEILKDIEQQKIGGKTERKMGA